MHLYSQSGHKNCVLVQMLQKSNSPPSGILQHIPNQHLRTDLRVLLCRPFSACHKKVEKVEKPTQNRPPLSNFAGGKNVNKKSTENRLIDFKEAARSRVVTAEICKTGSNVRCQTSEI